MDHDRSNHSDEASDTAPRPPLLQQIARRALRKDERGASLVEYALLVALIAVVCIAAVTQFGGSNGSGIDRSADSIVNAGL